MQFIEVRESKIAGKGCYALRRFKKGETIGEYTGERITEKEADARHVEGEPFYIFMLEDHTCIDPKDDPSPLKYINHSCDPNAESIEEKGKIFIRAIKTIRPGAEITYDYNVMSGEDDDELVCKCGAANCTGTMRADDDDD